MEISGISLVDLAAMAVTVLLVMLIAAIALYIYSALALASIAKKTNAKHAWLAWVPIANAFLLTNIAKIQWWITVVAIIVIFIPPYIGAVLTAGVWIWAWWKVAEARNRPGWYGILMIIPIVNLVVVGILAWGK